MTATIDRKPGTASQLVNGILAIKPLANLAKHQARQMMIKRAETIGVPWRDRARELRSQNLETELAAVEDPNLVYPEYYLRSFHAYDEGNLGWEPATEVEVAAKAVHAKIWPDTGANGDDRLRQSHLELLQKHISEAPRDILDLGCSVGMSTFALQETYPHAKLTGVDLSPYFLAVARYQSQQRGAKMNWRHAAAENTGLPDNSFDLVSLFLVCHELPQDATRKILTEVRRVLRPGGHLAIMDMNPASEIYAKMPPYVLTLLKSTEPYLDEYFAFDIAGEIEGAGFASPTIAFNSPRHRTIIAAG